MNKPVDENGETVRESVDALEEEDDVFLADNEIDELEQFVVEESTQTNVIVFNEDKNVSTFYIFCFSYYRRGNIHASFFFNFLSLISRMWTGGRNTQVRNNHL